MVRWAPRHEREVLSAAIGPALVDWQRRHGRQDLPWQRERSAYRVWISEVMLQQTQVSTVIDYFARFVARFPDVTTLADAPIDDVLHRWTGLGYYARARNLHRAAQIVRDQHEGELPTDFDAMVKLPGVGPSTAGAILAIACKQRHAILDGNAKRVLARLFAVQGHPAQRAVSLTLWRYAEACTPQQHVDIYTQAIMDLGATVCTRRDPACDICPVAQHCQALAQGRPNAFPAAKAATTPRRLRRQDRCVMLLACDAQGRVLLQQRPPSGIWGGLWSLPQFDDVPAAQLAALRQLSEPQIAPAPLAPVQHVFTHFDLEILPLRVQCSGFASEVREQTGAAAAAANLWYDPRAPQRVGLPAPVKMLIDQLDWKDC